MSGAGRYRRKTWTERMNTGRLPEWKMAEEQLGDIPAGSRMLISTPVMVDAAIRKIPPGVCLSISDLREAVAAEYEAAYVCPVTFGMNLRIVAESSYEQLNRGVPVTNVTPVWRVIHPSAPMARRCSFPSSFLQDQRQEEGISD